MSKIYIGKLQIIQAIKKIDLKYLHNQLVIKMIKKYEILVRMKDTKGDSISLFFIDRAKKINLYGEITKSSSKIIWIFLRVKYREFSINLSISDILEKKDICDFFNSKICEHDVGYFLTIEITESEGVENIEELVSL